MSMVFKTKRGKWHIENELLLIASGIIVFIIMVCVWGIGDSLYMILAFYVSATLFVEVRRIFERLRKRG